MTTKKAYEAVLAIALGLVIIHLVTENPYVLWSALGLMVLALLSLPLAKLIGQGWFKLAELLNMIISPIIMGVAFYLILTPIAFIYKLLGKDPLMLKRPEGSAFTERNKTYSYEDIENPW